MVPAETGDSGDLVVHHRVTETNADCDDVNARREELADRGGRSQLLVDVEGHRIPLAGEALDPSAVNSKDSLDARPEPTGMSSK